ADKNKVFDQWLVQREQTLKPDGIYMLICKDPPHIQVGVSDKVRQKLFRDSDRDQLVKTVIARFREKDFDGGLAQGLAFIDQSMQKSLAAAQPPKAEVPPVVTKEPAAPTGDSKQAKVGDKKEVGHAETVPVQKRGPVEQI